MEEAEDWSAFFSLIRRLLEECANRKDTRDEMYISTVLSRLDQSLSSVEYLLTELHARPNDFRDELRDVEILRSSLQNVRRCWQEKADLAGQRLLEESYVVDTVRTGAKGRPAFDVSAEQVESLRELRFSWVDIAEILGVSTTTLWRVRREFGMETDRRLAYDNLSDDQLDDVVGRTIAAHPDWGERLLMGALRQSLVHVQRCRLRSSLQRVDPIGRQLRWKSAIRRRPYSVLHPNGLWHIDSYMKLIHWGFVIHGGIDGFSRKIVYLSCSTNNQAATVLHLFLHAVSDHGLPSRVRADHGGESNAIEDYMIAERGEERRSMLRGSSVHNQRIERLWRDLYQSCVTLFYRLFHYLERTDCLDLSCALDIFALQHVFLPRINKALMDFKGAWNNHSIRTARGRTPEQLFVAGCLATANRARVPDIAVLDPGVVANDYGIDWDGPAGSDGNDAVYFPIVAAGVREEHLQHLREQFDPLMHADNYGIDCYHAVRQILQEWGY